MKFEKLRNFCWGIAFGTCFFGAITTKDETVIIPILTMVLIGIAFIINFNKE